METDGKALTNKTLPANHLEATRATENLHTASTLCTHSQEVVDGKYVYGLNKAANVLHCNGCCICSQPAQGTNFPSERPVRI